MNRASRSPVVTARSRPASFRCARTAPRLKPARIRPTLGLLFLAALAATLVLVLARPPAGPASAALSNGADRTPGAPRAGLVDELLPAEALVARSALPGGPDPRRASVRSAPGLRRYCGRVLDAHTKEPIENVRVEFASSFVRTDADGAFEFHAANAPVQVFLRADDHRDGGFSVDPPADPDVGIDLELRRLHEVALVLVDGESGAPMEGVRVRPRGKTPCRTDATGEILVRTVVGGPLGLEGEHPATLDLAWKLDAYSPDRHGARIELPMTRAAFVTGIVREADGRPSDGAWLQTRSDPESTPLAPRRGRLAPPGLLDPSASGRVATDADGTFRLAVQARVEGLQLSISQPEGPGRALLPLPALAAGEEHHVQTSFAAPGGLDISVLLNGKAPEYVLIDIESGSSWITSHWRHCFMGGTAEPARFEGLTPWTYEIDIAIDGSSAKETRRVRVEPGRIETVEFVFRTDPFRLRGRTEDPAGSPLGGVELFATGPDGSALSFSSSESDGEGRFELELDHEGGLVLQARQWGGSVLDGRASLRIEDPEELSRSGEDIVLVLDPAPVLRFALVDGTTGRPVGEGLRNLRAEVYDARGRHLDSQTLRQEVGLNVFWCVLENGSTAERAVDVRLELRRSGFAAVALENVPVGTRADPPLPMPVRLLPAVQGQLILEGDVDAIEALRDSDPLWLVGGPEDRIADLLTDPRLSELQLRKPGRPAPPAGLTVRKLRPNSLGEVRLEDLATGTYALVCPGGRFELEPSRLLLRDGTEQRVRLVKR